MRKIVFSSGLWNVGVGAGMFLAALDDRFGVPVPRFWGIALSAFIWFTAVVLIFASRDLERRAPLVYWQALLRFYSAALLFALGRETLGALPAWFVGTTDLAWGLIYIVGVPRALKRATPGTAS